jgi:hypothetical protein
MALWTPRLGFASALGSLSRERENSIDLVL